MAEAEREAKWEREAEQERKREAEWESHWQRGRWAECRWRKGRGRGKARAVARCCGTYGSGSGVVLR